MTTQEQIAVMQGYVNGKEIEMANKGVGNWEDISTPYWNWDDLDYRIKPEPKYHPFANAEEVMEAIKEHGDWVKDIHNNDIFKITMFNDAFVQFGGIQTGYKYDEAFKDNVWPDGTPFGKLED